MIKKLFCFICALFLAACSTSVDGRDRRIGDTGEPTPIPTAVAAARPTYEVDRGEVIYEIVFPGRIAAVVEQALVFSLDGIVSQVYVQRGQRVQAGDPVADLDISTWEAELVLAQSALAIAQAQLDSSQREISLARQRAELSESRQTLAEILGRSPTTFSYPHGDNDAETRLLVRQAGFQLACSSQNGIVHKRQDHFALPRFWVPDWDGEQFGRWLARWIPD